MGSSLSFLTVVSSDDNEMVKLVIQYQCASNIFVFLKCIDWTKDNTVGYPIGPSLDLSFGIEQTMQTNRQPIRVVRKRSI